MRSYEERFSELFMAHYTQVRAYAARRVGESDADDIAAECFSAAFRRLDDAPSNELPWLIGIARGLVSNHRRSTRRLLSAHQRLEAQADRAHVDVVEEPSSGPTIAALESLPDRDQEILKLIAWDELTVADVAQVLGCTRTNVAVRLHRARGRFRRALAQHEDPLPPPAPGDTGHAALRRGT